MKHSGLNLDKLYAIELIGGATRVPKSHYVFFLFHIDLPRHVNVIESMLYYEF